MGTHSNEKSIENAIYELKKQYPNERVIPIFCGAIYIGELMDKNEFNLDTFAKSVIDVAQNACFWHWHTGCLSAMRTYCHLCYVDPMLLEAYLQERLETIAIRVEEFYAHKKQLQEQL